jgi:colanic acid biosynthesis glycosyl transferase WcaI
MRILIVGINFFPEPTGTGKFTGEMALYLRQKGHEVHVVTAPPYYPQWKIQPGYQGWRYQTEIWNGVHICRCPLWVPKKVTTSNRLLHLLSFALSSLPVVLIERSKHTDLVFAIAPALFSAPLAAFPGKKIKGKNWLHIQDFEVDAAINLGMVSRLPAVERLAHAWETRVFQKFGTISTISGAMIEKLKEKHVEEDRLYYFPNWIDPAAIFPLTGENRYRKVLGLKSSDIVVLYSGSIGEKQGIEILIETARLLKDHPEIHIVICGDGPAKPTLQKLGQGIANLHFLPVQPAESLNELLNSADIHVLPQKAGATDLVMPSKLLGMLASGRPVIAGCPVGSELHKIISEVGVAVPPEDPIALAREITGMAMDASSREKLGALGRSLVIERFSMEKVLGDFEKRIMALCDESNKSDSSKFTSE